MAGIFIVPNQAKAVAYYFSNINLPAATVGQYYSGSVDFTSCNSYFGNTAGQSLPPGLSLGGPSTIAAVTGNPNDSTNICRIFITGIPTQAGNFTFQITLDSFSSYPSAQSFNLPVNSNSSLQITSSSLPDATVGQPYSAQLQATGGVAPYKWSPVSTTYASACCVLGINGDGPTFNTQTSPTVQGPAGNYLWTVKVTDANGNTVQKTISLAINSPGTPGSFSISKLSFDFFASQGDTNQQYQDLTFTNITNSAISYIISVDNQPSWLNTGYTQNTYLTAYANTPTGLGAQVNPSNLGPGKYTTSIKISGNSPGSTLIIPVNLTISPSSYPPPLPTSSPVHANYTNVAGPDGTVYRIENGARYPYTSAGAFLSYGFNNWATVVPATSGDMQFPLATYTPSGGTQPTTYFIPPRNGSLINDKGTIYLITNGLRTGFASAQAFLGLGYSFNSAQPGDTSFMVTLAPINSSEIAHPDGTLVRDGATIYLLKNNTRLGVPSIAVFYSWGLNMNEVVPANNYDRATPVSGVLNSRMDNQLSI